MAIGAGAAGAWAANNATTQTVTLPAHAAGDILVLIAACKTATVTSLNIRVTTPSTGWTRIGNFADSSTASGVGTGGVTQAIFTRVATSASETNPVVTWGGSQTATPGIAVALGFTKASTEMWLPVAVQKATNAATSISVTMNSNPGITAGDYGIVVHTIADDSALTVPTWTATSATLGTATVYPTTPIADGTSNDMAGTAAYRAVTSGTASAAPVCTATAAAAETGVTGFIRLRVATAATYQASVTADSPLAYFRMGEASGAVVDSISAANGTVTGSVTRDVTGLVADDDGAIDFSGSGYFEAAWPAAIAQVWTLEVILSVPSGSGFVTFISSADWYLTYNITTGAMTSGVAGNVGPTVAASTVTTGTHHFVWSRAGTGTTQNKIYIDGVDVTVAPGVTTTSADTATVFRFGEYIDGSESFLGTADELAIYSSALSQTQVLTHYAAMAVPAANQLVTPTTAALTATKFAPTVRLGQTVTPTTKAVVLATFAPKVNLKVIPPLATLTATKFAPTVTISNNQRVTPTTAALVATKYAPTVRTPILATPSTVSLTVTKYAPTIRLSTLATPTTKALVLATFAPSVAISNNQRVTPTTATLTATRFAPTIRTPILATPTTKAAVLTTFAPAVTASDHQRVVPTTRALVITRYEPDLSQSDAKTAIPTTKALTLQTYPPTVTAPNPQLVTVPKASLTLTKFAPTARTPILATPGTKTLTITKYAPTVRLPILVTPATKTLTASTYQPTIASPRIVTVPPASLITSRFAPTVSFTAHQRVTPATKALTLSTFAPVARIAYRFTPTTKALTLATFAPTVSFTTNVLARPANAALVLTTYPPTIPLTGHQLVEPLPGALYLATYAPTVEVHSITPLPRIVSGTVVIARGPGATVTTRTGSTTVVVAGRPSARVSR